MTTHTCSQHTLFQEFYDAIAQDMTDSKKNGRKIRTILLLRIEGHDDTRYEETTSGERHIVVAQEREMTVKEIQGNNKYEQPLRLYYYYLERASLTCAI